MPTTIIFGGSGKVARNITRILTSATPPHTVHSVIRNPDQVQSLTTLGANPIVQSIEESSVADFTQTIQSVAPECVIWSAGAGGGNPARTLAVDHEGAIRVMDATAQAGVKRFIMVSAHDLRDRENRPVPDWYGDHEKHRSDKLWGTLTTYMKAKLAADTELKKGNDRRGLQYTIVRPGSLSEENGVGAVAAGKVHWGEKVSREDVARVVVECMKNEGTVGLAFDVVDGETPVQEAVRKVAEGKVDCFDGYY